jgi:hypothetical protein
VTTASLQHFGWFLAALHVEPPSVCGEEVNMVRTLKICLVDPDPTRTAAFIQVHLRGGLGCLLAAEYYPAGFAGVRIFRSRQ